MFSYWMSEFLISFGVKCINIAHGFYCDGYRLTVDELIRDCEMCVDDWVSSEQVED